VSRDQVTQGLSVMANVCFEMVRLLFIIKNIVVVLFLFFRLCFNCDSMIQVLNKKFDKDETNMFCLRAMTGKERVCVRVYKLYC